MSETFSFCPSCHIFTLSHAAVFFSTLFHKLPLTACYWAGQRYFHHCVYI